jgi:hypothetical protein
LETDGSPPKSTRAHGFRSRETHVLIGFGVHGKRPGEFTSFKVVEQAALLKLQNPRPHLRLGSPKLE